MLMILLLIMFIVMPYFGPILGFYFGLVLDPVIGFSGRYPIITILFAGLVVVFLSSLLTNFFTDWKKMGESQETAKAFQNEIGKARREGNTNRIKSLMKMQPEIMKKQTEASGGMMKPMVFLIIFIWPIFLWLRTFLTLEVPHYYFTLPWGNSIPLISTNSFIMQAWLWLYLVFSLIMGQVFRQAFKLASWSNWWKSFKSKLRPSFV